MKSLFIPANSKLKISQTEISKLNLPKNIALFYSIQYKNQAQQIRNILSQNHDITAFAQVLGCSKPKIPKQTQTILLITDGKFHALSLASETDMPVYIYNKTLTKIPEKEIQQLRQKQKASYINYLNSDKVGILVSTKPGQQNLGRAIQFKNKSKKKSYLFIANNINTVEFENFPDIQSWVNTACPRLSFDSGRIVNIGNLK